MTEKECLCTTPEITIELNQQGPPGQQGLPGTDGFSPKITVAQQSNTSYVLTILTSEGQFNTPNLQGAGVPSNGIYGQYLMSNGGSDTQWVDLPVATEGSQGIISIADSDDLENNDNTSAITPAILNNKVQPATPTIQGLVHPNNPLYISPTDNGELFILEANVGQQGTVQYGPQQSDVTNMSFLGLDDNRPSSGEAKLNGVWLPVAKTNVLGGVKPDGTTITVTADGTISSVGSGSTYVLPQATSTELGGIKANEVTATDTQEVRINTTTGILYTAPGLPDTIDGGNAGSYNAVTLYGINQSAQQGLDNLNDNLSNITDSYEEVI